MSNTRTYILVGELGSDLSSRARASALRARVVSAVEGGCQHVHVDLQGVRTISSSFADELFAVIVAAKGEEWFKAHIKVVNVSVSLRRTILEAIEDRLAHGTTMI